MLANCNAAMGPPPKHQTSCPDFVNVKRDRQDCACKTRRRWWNAMRSRSVQGLFETDDDVLLTTSANGQCHPPSRCREVRCFKGPRFRHRRDSGGAGAIIRLAEGRPADLGSPSRAHNCRRVRNGGRASGLISSTPRPSPCRAGALSSTTGRRRQRYTARLPTDGDEAAPKSTSRSGAVTST